MELAEFKAKAQEVEFANVLAEVIEQSCSLLDFDLQCIDWFVSSPDVANFYIEQKNKVAA